MSEKLLLIKEKFTVVNKIFGTQYCTSASFSFQLD
jgi:hypothetical protein